MNPALVIIDIQNDYFLGGKMELVGMNSAADKAKELLSIFRKNNWPVLHVRHLSIRANATFFIPETIGSEINETVRPLETETVVIKNYPNIFRNTGLNDLLHSLEITNLVICGAMSHMCIDTSVRAAFDLGYNCTVISDACATRDLVFNNEKVDAAKVHLSFMAALNGTFGKVLNIDQFKSSL